jgi:hypothetical protein
MPYNNKRSVLGRRLVAGHRILVPVVEVRILPPQFFETGRNGDGEKKTRI